MSFFVETYGWGWVMGAWIVGVTIGFMLGFAVAVLVTQRIRQEADAFDVAMRQVNWSEMQRKEG